MVDLFDTLQKERENDRTELKTPTRFIPTTYHDVEFEGRCDGQYRSYNDSLSSLRARGYERHPRTSEVFTLLADSLEGKLSQELEAVAQNLQEAWWGWCSLVWESKGDLLLAYLDPMGLVWDKNKWVHVKQPDFQYTSEHYFDIADKKSDIWISLREFPDDFVVFHYGRKFSDLPQKMQDDAYIWLPPDGALRALVLGVDGSNGRFGVNANVYINGGWPARGVVSVVAQKSRVETKGRK